MLTVVLFWEMRLFAYFVILLKHTDRIFSALKPEQKIAVWKVLNALQSLA